MERIAWALVVLGSLVLLGYAAYYAFDALLNEPGVPVPVQVAVPVVLAGLIILVIVGLKDRIVARRKEDFREDDS